MILSIISILIWAIIVPFILGTLIVELTKVKESGFAACFAFGYVVMCAVFQLLAVPMIAGFAKFHVLKNAWLVAIAVLIIIALIKCGKSLPAKIKSALAFEEIRKLKRAELALIAATIVIILCQTALLSVGTHIDTDDARFVAEAVDAVEKDSMLEVHPITGEFLGYRKGEMFKDIVSPFPFFLSLLSVLFRLPPAVVAHTVLPVLFIPLCYVVFSLVARLLFRGNVRNTWLFLFFISLIHLFSFESDFSHGYTLLTIIWQGRSAYAMILMPLLWYWMMRISGEEECGVMDYAVLALIEIAAALHSGMGAVLTLTMAVAYLFVICMRRRTLRTIISVGISLIPCALYVFLYLISYKIFQ